MKILKIAFVVMGIAAFLVPFVYYTTARVGYEQEQRVIEPSKEEADLPPEIEEDEELGGIDREEYIMLREQHIATLMGRDTAKRDSRPKAIREMEESERELAQRGDAPAAAWQSLGPAPIPISSTTAYSGRVSAIAVHPTNPDIVYVGTAFGGLYRSLNGGASWTPLMDNALSLAIGSIAFVPNDPTTIFVGTGEGTLSGTSFAGVGIYKITNADTSPVLTGPLNKNASNNDIFTGRAVSEIVIDPNNPNVLFATSTSGTAGIGGSTNGLPLPNAGLYRTTNALSANPVFVQLTIQGTNFASRSAVDAVIEPGNAARLLISIIGSGGDGGVYLTTNALDPAPTFTRTLTTGDGSNLGRTEFAANKVGGVTTIFAAAGTANGTLYKSTDGGVNFVQAVANNFCNPQCFYDIAVAVDPNDANKVFLGGSPTLPFGRSENGGSSFTSSSTGLHVDTQAFGVAPSNPNIVYFGSDGGIWRTDNVNATPITWQTLNNSTFSATQFTGLALHPLDRNYTLGGTQDNGTEFLAPDGTTWVRSDGGDGGFAVIDQNAPNINNVTAYHTYFNRTGSQIGFRRGTTTDSTGDPIWSTFFGCGGTANGINCADSVLFYAPMVRGPGNPNTLYFGTNRVYRSANTGVTMTDVSGTLTGTVSAIGISPQNDDVRLAGTTSGRVYLSTTAGATTMTEVTGAIPARYIGRIAVDPNNSNIAYVTITGYGVTSHVWKTTNLLTGAPTWTAAGNGIPDVPTDTFVVDPANSQQLFAGTDIGVFRSTDGGANWQPFNDNLPRVPVFGMEIQPVHRVLKIATHGRGMYEYDLNAVNRKTFFDFDGDSKSDISVFRPSNGAWYIQQSTAGFTGVIFGFGSDTLTPADFDGDGKTDVAVFRDGFWYRLNSSDGTFTGLEWGLSTDIPIPADFDGDGKADVNVFRPSDGGWYRLNSSTGAFFGVNFGLNGDKPLVANFDGDGKSDIAVFRPSTASFYSLDSSTGNFRGVTFGLSTDIPTMGDFDGDGKTDVAVFRPSNGAWYRLNSSTGAFFGTLFGQNGDIPVPADYDGDGKTDIAVFRSGNWYYLRSSNGAFVGLNFGFGTDKPIPAAFVR